MATASKREQWTRQVSEFERSGLSRRAWCAARGVNLLIREYWPEFQAELASQGRYLPAYVTKEFDERMDANHWL